MGKADFHIHRTLVTVKVQGNFFLNKQEAKSKVVASMYHCLVRSTIYSEGKGTGYNQKPVPGGANFVLPWQKYIGNDGYSLHPTRQTQLIANFTQQVF